MPFARAAGSVLATTPTSPAWKPFEMNVFAPLITYSSPRRARACLDRLQVGARAGLGHRDRANELAAGHARQPAMPLLLGAVIEHVVRDDAVHDVTEARDALAADLLDDDRLVADVAAQSAVLGRYIGAQQADLAGLGPEVAIDEVLFAPAGVIGDDLVFDEAARSVAEELELVVHPGGSGVGQDLLRWVRPRIQRRTDVVGRRAGF